MYAVRLWSTRHARLMERVYELVNPAVVGGLRALDKLFGAQIDRPVAAMEAAAKGFLFDCKMCGNCVLGRTGMSCPMNCPKQIRNGPCGGVRDDGSCEVDPNMRCVWVEAWAGAAQMRGGVQIGELEGGVDHRLVGSSAWLRIARDGQ